MKHRLLYAQLKKHISHKNALVVTGMRQVGKTTLLKGIYESLGNAPKAWFDFDNPLDMKVFEDIDYNDIHRRLIRKTEAKKGQRMNIFIDEIQNFPEVTKVVKYLLDHYETKFFLTGSSSFYLKNLFPESLSGRKFLYVLSPLSFQEFLYFRGEISGAEAESRDIQERIGKKDIHEYKRFDESYEEYLLYGGFPEVVLTEGESTKNEILRNIFASFFEKDLRMLSDYTDIRQLRDLILLLVPRVGSLVDITRLASSLGVTRARIYQLLEFLQGTFFLHLLPRFSGSVDRSVAGGKKVYFSDTGILNTVGNVNDAQLFENSVINQLQHYGDVCFYNKRNTAEIDAVLNKELALEIKLTATESDIKRVRKISKKIGISEAYVVSKSFVSQEGAVFPMFL